MNKRLSDFMTTDKFGMSYAIITSAVIGGIIYAIGNRIGEIKGIDETNSRYMSILSDIKEENHDEEE